RPVFPAMVGIADHRGRWRSSRGTERDGGFVLDGVPERAFLRIESPGFVTRFLELWAPVGDLVVDLDAPSGDVEGVVVEVDGREVRGGTSVQALAGSRVLPLDTPARWTLDAPGWRAVPDEGLVLDEARTDGSGRFTLRGLRAGRPAHVGWQEESLDVPV